MAGELRGIQVEAGSLPRVRGYKTEPQVNSSEQKAGASSRTASAMPLPQADERPTVYADRVGAWYVARQSDRHRKAHGLYLTPVLVADFMARQISVAEPKLKLLEPAAGTGVLCCATVEVLVSRTLKPQSIELIAYEVDEQLIVPLRAVLDYLASWCRDRDVAIAVHVKATDFILAHADALRLFGAPILSRPREHGFDLVISNPPYFKIGKADPRAAAAAGVVHGQPNIYALFMAVSAALLRTRGDFIFLTPRSFTSGSYFRQFRTIFFDMIRPTAIHVFGSRRDTFSRDEVLQENVIVWGLRQDRWHKSKERLDISSSRGIRDIGEANRRRVPLLTALDPASVDKVLRLPICSADDAVLALVDAWPSSLHRLGLRISTGPVVPFRATTLTDKEGTVPARHVPLLWMNHVHAMRITWPLDWHKPEYIARAGAEALLVPNKNYVLLRRFSAKEEARRLTAAPCIAADFALPAVGLENHLNYIYRPGGMLSEDEAWGLAALYNSRLLNTYFRAINGNTQVSATELRAMPLPAGETISTLGRRIKRRADPLADLDPLVMSLLAPPGFKEAVGCFSLRR